MISLRNISKSFNGRHILRDINFHVSKGECLCLVGSSGVGKSTILNIIAGLILPDTGEIEVNGRLVEQKNQIDANPIHLHPSERNLGYVMQDSGLFPHMTMYQNISFPLEAKNLSKDIIERKVKKLMNQLEISDIAHQYPSHASGGQIKRVALARSLVQEPPILLMDEPLSSLDRNLKDLLKSKIRNLVSDLNLTIIYVTHDLSEAKFIANRIAVVKDGIIKTAI